MVLSSTGALAPLTSATKLPSCTHTSTHGWMDGHTHTQTERETATNPVKEKCRLRSAFILLKVADGRCTHLTDTHTHTERERERDEENVSSPRPASLTDL